MAEESLRDRIEREISRRAGLDVVVEDEGDVITLSGRVDSEENRDAALTIAAALSPGRRVEDNIEVEAIIPDQPYEELASGIDESDLPASLDEIRDRGGDVEPDFTDQPMLTDPVAAAGPSGSADDAVAEGDETYVPPTDPVVTTNERGETEVLGGFSPTSDDQIQVDRSASDNRLGDEAIEDAIRRELREDAATTDLLIRVIVRNGVAHLHGTVDGPEDADNAEEVASRVPGVIEVREELEVGGL